MVRLFLSMRSYQEAEGLAHEVLLAAASLQAAQPQVPSLLGALATVTSSCEPPSVLALHCLIFLASASPLAQEQMVAHGVVPLLAGQLLGASDTLEPALRLGSLHLLQLLTAGCPKHIVHDGSLGAVLRVVVTCLRDHQQQPRVCGMGLGLLQELAYSRKVLQHKVLTSQILPALEALISSGSTAELTSSAARLHKLLICLPKLMKA
ncbi:hypothetical protein DUNSADRAFT_13536 [Dunaliella salina]|uniref:Uncharacterized protein n=1 Tax=Dunaliella salina TaxID=3046 RepID=A0ABQ7G949_DUNSA|nr:hypothetical protein DUNSADRAFT_13536 [Dunaliella salina]|eukprot:KAF5831133.1 hypothetical protein DUNSADRAFT_13536 [Dunaliella salina]